MYGDILFAGLKNGSVILIDIPVRDREMNMHILFLLAEIYITGGTGGPKLLDFISSA